VSDLEPPPTTSALQLVPYRAQGRKQAIVFLYASNMHAGVTPTLPAFLGEGQELAGWDILTVSYKSPLASFSLRPITYSEIAEEFYRELVGSGHLDRYEHIAIVAHSVSGLIARKAILDHADLAGRVSYLFLLAVPNSGLRIPFLPPSVDATKLLNLSLNALGSFPLLGIGVVKSLLALFLGSAMKPITDLLSGSDWLRGINDRWKDQFAQGPPFQYWAIAAQSDRSVGVDSLLAVAPGNRLIVPGDHESVIRPAGASEASVTIIRKALTQQTVPGRAQKAAEAIALLEQKVQAGQFDVVLCHGWSDRAAVRVLGNHLKQLGLRPWISEELDLDGQRWTVRLKEKIEAVSAIAVCFGKSKPPDKEQADLIPLFDSRGRPVIPVLLPDCAAQDQELPEGYLPIDFRDRESEPFRRFVRTVIRKEPEFLPEGAEEIPELYESKPTESKPKEKSIMKPEPAANLKPDIGKTGLWQIFGKYGGVAGIALGVVLVLYRKVLEEKVFPTLQPQQAFLVFIVLLFLTAALTAAGMLIWASQVKAGRSVLASIVIVVLAMFGITGYAMRPASQDSAYRIRVTVLNPSNVPVNEAHVWSTLGGESKQIDGGWEIDIHGPPQPSGIIIAEVKDAAWRGQAQLELARGHDQAISVQLESKGEANIRGTVVDENGDIVPRVFVSVTGFPGVTTDADGNFNLPAHVSGGLEVELHVGGGGFKGLTQTVSAGAKPVTVVLRHDKVKELRNGSNSQPASPSAERTGDVVIDRVLARLAALQKSSEPPSESLLAEALAPLFNRPAFYAVSSGDWQSLLYPLCRTRLLLEQYLTQFKSSPTVRDSLTQTTQQMVRLQDRLASLYGPSFHLSENIRRYIGKSDTFTSHLPSVIEQPSTDVIAASNADIKTIRTLVKKAGFPIQ
jgi:hypothetical protein